LRDGCDLPLGLGHGRDDFVRGFLILDLDVFAFVFEELGFEERRLASIEQGVDRPILLRHEGADFLLAFDDQAESNGLNTSRGKTAANLIPEKRRNFVTNDAVENAPGLLRVDKIRVDFPGMLESSANCFGRNLVEGDTEDFLRVDRRNFFFRVVLDRFYGYFGFGVFFS